MLRLFAFASVILVGGLLYGLSRGEAPVETAMERVGTPGATGLQLEGTTSEPSRPLRMRSTSATAPAADRAPVDKIKLSIADAFAQEPIGDAEKAAERNQMIRGVIRNLIASKVGRAQIAELECRTQHCLIRITEEGDDVSALIDALQDERGFLGKAESLMLSRDEQAVRVYLRFSNDEESGTATTR